MHENPRKTTADILYSTLVKSSSASSEIDAVRRKNIYSDADMRFVSEVVFGCLRKLEYIDYAISYASNIKLNKISPFVLCVMRTGAYQILFMDRVPDSAAVNESVKIIRRCANPRASGFANAVLRKVAANRTNILLPKDKSELLSIEYSCPRWIVDSWQSHFGEQTQQILSAMNKKPPTFLRANSLRTDSARLCEMLRADGWECSVYHSDIFPQAADLLQVTRIGKPISEVKAYRDGLFYIQDAAAAYAAYVLAPKAGMHVIDMCAAPGGKSTHMAELMKNSGKITAFDIYPEKLGRINDNAQRLGIGIIDTVLADSTVYNDSYRSSADCVLADVPCSGLGIIRRKPDIKYTRKKDDITALANIGYKVLCNAAMYLKPGGRMVFSTCTTERAENEDNLFRFLDAHPEFKLKKINCGRENDGYITLLPNRDGCDGFFISVVERDK